MRILLVEDNRRLSEAIKAALYKAGFSVDVVDAGEEALAVLIHQIYDAIILDLGLPDIDGIKVLEELRDKKNTTPVLILTARGSLSDRVSGLNGGADDYLVKPFDVEELIARLNALLRRPNQLVESVISLNNLSFDTKQRQVTISDKVIKLSRRETDLLEQLIRMVDKVVTKEAIEMQMYSYGEIGSANSIEVLVHRLRKKLADNKSEIQIHTLHGIGYMITRGRKNGTEKS